MSLILWLFSNCARTISWLNYIEPPHPKELEAQLTAREQMDEEVLRLHAFQGSILLATFGLQEGEMIGEEGMRRYLAIIQGGNPGQGEAEEVGSAAGFDGHTRFFLCCGTSIHISWITASRPSL